MRFGAPALLAPEAGEARGGAQFVAPRALLAGDREGGAENDSSVFAGSGYGKPR